MRQFASSGFRLWNLGAAAKVLYTSFCLLTLLGVVSSALFYADLVGAGLGGVRAYYAGEEAGAAPSAPGAPGARTAPRAGPAGDTAGATGAAAGAAGPAIDLPDEPPSRLVVAVTYRKLLEVTHFHLFTIPVVLLIVGHLFLATDLSERAKLGWIAGTAVGAALHLATPWLLRYAGGGLAALHAVSGGLFTLGMLVLTIYPVIAMWRGRPATAPA